MSIISKVLLWIFIYKNQKTKKTYMNYITNKSFKHYIYKIKITKI